MRKFFFILMLLWNYSVLASIDNAFVDCEICYENKLTDETLQCNQGHRYCDVCLAKFWEPNPPKCPDIQCQQKYDYALAEELLIKLFRKHPEKINNKYWKVQQVDGDGDLVVGRFAAQKSQYCICPDCESIYSKRAGVRQRFCEQEACVRKRQDGQTKFAGFCQECSVAFHFHGDCPVELQVKDWQVRIRHDAKTDEYIKTNCKACPNPQCLAFIFKDGGCNAMVCGHRYHDSNGESVACNMRFDFTDRANRDLTKPLALPITDEILKQYRIKFWDNLDKLDLKEPIDTSDNQFEENGQILSCSQCSQKILSVRFECLHCENTSFCRSCMKQHLEAIQHEEESFLKQVSIFLGFSIVRQPLHESEHVFRKEFSDRQKNYLGRPQPLLRENTYEEATFLAPERQGGASPRQEEMRRGLEEVRRDQVHGAAAEVCRCCKIALGTVSVAIFSSVYPHPSAIYAAAISFGFTAIIGCCGGVACLDVQDGQFRCLASDIFPLVRRCETPQQHGNNEYNEYVRQRSRVLREIARRALCVHLCSTRDRE